MTQVNAWYPYISNTGKSVIWLSWDIYESKQQESKCLKLIIIFSLKTCVRRDWIRIEQWLQAQYIPCFGMLQADIYYELVPLSSWRRKRRGREERKEGRRKGGKGINKNINKQRPTHRVIRDNTITLFLFCWDTACKMGKKKYFCL